MVPDHTDSYTDANNDLPNFLSQEYSDSVNFSDGDIFLAIREYHYSVDKQLGAMFAEKCMWARLSINKCKDLKQILKHKAFTKALDALRILPGIWPGFRIAHKFMSIKCDEVHTTECFGMFYANSNKEILHYMNYILTSWTSLVGGRKDLMQFVDRVTVETLQLRAPGTSCKDLNILEKPFQEKVLFSDIQHQRDRSVVWMGLQGFIYLIPSMYTLFEDIKYLRAPAKVMRQLFSKTSETCFDAMTAIFTGRNQKDHTYLIQTSERSFREEKGQSVDQIKFGYHVAWLYLWRHWTDLGPDCPRKDDGEPTPMPRGSSITKWFELANLVTSLGFESDEISQILSSDPDRKLAIEVLLTARDPEYFVYEESAFEAYLDQMVAMFKSAHIKPGDDVDSASGDHGDEGLQRRCGRIFEKSHKHSRKHLFLDTLYGQLTGEKRAISSTFVRASVFVAFFGKISGQATSTNMQDPSNITIQPPESVGAANAERTMVVLGAGPTVEAPAIPSTQQTALTVIPEFNDALVAIRPNGTITGFDELQENMPGRIFVKLWENNALVDQERPLRIYRDEITNDAKERALRFPLIRCIWASFKTRQLFRCCNEQWNANDRTCQGYRY